MNSLLLFTCSANFIHLISKVQRKIYKRFYVYESMQYVHMYIRYAYIFHSHAINLKLKFHFSTAIYFNDLLCHGCVIGCRLFTFYIHTTFHSYKMIIIINNTKGICDYHQLSLTKTLVKETSSNFMNI